MKYYVRILFYIAEMLAKAKLFIHI